MNKIKLPQNVQFSKVKKINFDYLPTYDIEVENSHYYLTENGIISHNSLSLMTRNMTMSSGIEPPFGLYYWKRTRISGKYEYYFIVPYEVRKLFEEKGYKIPMESDTIKDTWDGLYGKPVAEFIEKHKNLLGIKIKKDTEINALDKLNLMKEVMQNIDSSISVTYNLPEGTDYKGVAEFILKAYKAGVKSVAAFPDKKMYGIVSTIPFKELAFKLKDEGVEIHSQNFIFDELEELNLTSDKIQYSSAPKRPKKLEADLHIINVKKEKYLIAIGLLNGAPYEVFGGKLKDMDFKFKFKQGIIEKTKRGIYKLEFDDQIIENFSDHFDLTEQAMLRLISTSLRHGVSSKFIVEQLHKSTFDMFSFTSALARVLKKYIKDGESATGINCPNCKATALIYADGCVKCSICEWSKCD